MLAIVLLLFCGGVCAHLCVKVNAHLDSKILGLSVLCRYPRIEMKSVFICLFALHITLSSVKSQAPGDADSFCTQESGSTPLPPYPPNSRILMDSYQYISLLPALGRESTWQQVDVDNRSDDSGGRTDVSG